MSQPNHREVTTGHYSFDQLVGMSASMVDVLRMIEVCTEKDEPVILLIGEPGTGKSLVAQAIHICGLGPDAPFVKFDCTKMSEDNFEKDLFGDSDGIRSRRPLSQREPSVLADRTVFIAGIGHLPPFLQYKLSRQLEGGLSGSVRIIASTSRNLQELVERGLFSAELFGLLRATTIFLPPLRQRRECIPALVDYFIGYYNNCYGKAIRGARLATMTLLQQYDWPGNVRELRQVIGYAVRHENSSLLTPVHLPAEVYQKKSISNDGKCHLEELAPAGSSWITLPPDGITLEGVEKKLIEQALQRFSGNQSKAARCLGMSRDTIRYRIKKFGLERKGRTKSL